MKKLIGMLFALVVVAAILPGTALDAQAAATDQLSGSYTDTTIQTGEYTLAGDVTLSGSVSVSGVVTIDLNGKTLSGSAAPYFTVEQGGKLTIKDQTGGGKIQGIKDGREMLSVSGTLILDGGTLTGHNNTSTGAGAVKIEPAGEFIMNGGEISGNQAAYGGGVCVVGEEEDYGKVTLTGGVIKDNSSTNQNGSAIYAQFAELSLSATSLSKGVVITGVGEGDTIFCEDSTITMSAGFIDADAAAGSSAIHLQGSSKAEFTGRAVVGGDGVKCDADSTARISSLRRIGTVTSQSELNYDTADITVGEKTTGSKRTYAYARPVDRSILFIGNSYSRDSLDALAHVGDALGLNIEVAYLYESSCTLRRHAYGLDKSDFKPYYRAKTKDQGKNVPKGALYEYYSTNPATGNIESQNIYANIPYVLRQYEWDVVTLQQASSTAAFPGTYNSDIEFLVDYIKATEPDAELYWNMTWSLDLGYGNAGQREAEFAEYYDNSTEAMYNGIVDVVNRNFAEGGVFHEDFAGWLPVGAAIQKMRELEPDLSMSRDGLHLSYKGGRFIASLTVLKTLYPELDITQLKPEDLTFVATEMDTSKPDEFNVEAHLDAAVRAVKFAAGEAKEGHHTKLEIAPGETVESVTDNASMTVAQTAVPLKPQFPSAERLNNGTVVVAAYENVTATPRWSDSEFTWDRHCHEGAGRIVIWDGDGTNWNYDQPLAVIDQAQLEKWGISETAGRYTKLKASPTAGYTIFSDPRDPELTVVTVDADNDGRQDDEMLVLTFWLRDYTNTGVEERGTYMAYSVDGGRTWKLGLDGNGRTDTPCYVCGDAAVFSDGSILMPCTTSDSSLGTLSLTWNPRTKLWKENGYRQVTTVSDVTQLALASPDGSDTVYAFAGGNGAVLKSDDCGQSWSVERAGNQSVQIDQPGLSVIDDSHVFATWTSIQTPYDTYGKVIDLNEAGDWAVSSVQPLYNATGTDKGKNEAGSPDAVLLDTGDVLVVSYDSNYRSVVGTIVEMAQDGPMDDMSSAPTKKGYVFAGWYADESYSKVYDGTTDSAYAKFVNKNVLSVKVQISADSEKTDLRLVTTVDSVYYKQVGFRVTVGGVQNSMPIVSSTVFTRIAANDGGVAYDHAPDVFSAQSRYFMTYTIAKIPNEVFGAEIVVVPYWVTLDGTEVEGEKLTFTIDEVIKANAPASGGLSSSESGTGDSESFGNMFGDNS